MWVLGAVVAERGLLLKLPSIWGWQGVLEGQSEDGRMCFPHTEIYMNFLGISEITGEWFLVGKRKLSFCISRRWEKLKKSQQHPVLNLNSQADKLGRFGGYIYITVNLETNKISNSSRLSYIHTTQGRVMTQRIHVHIFYTFHFPCYPKRPS